MESSLKNSGKDFYSDRQGSFIVAGDGRNLSEIPDNFFDAIITDHPWLDEKSNKGGNRHFDGDYSENSFTYTLSDFVEKHRVLKEGCFLVENLPEENSNNFEYLYSIKKMAIEAGFEYYSQVPWIKGSFVSNTGRKSKNSETLLFLTKGKARGLRVDQKKSKITGKTEFMSGAAKMLPLTFDFQPPHSSQKKHKAEKPILLLESIIELITLPNEVVLDQFAGSLNIVAACLNKNRRCFAYELNKNFIRRNLQCLNQHFQEDSHD
jgi:site-specific DNA-methyltransferase (adenine-specific)